MNKPTKIYAEVLERTALEQFTSAMEQDYSIRGALMADAHTGYGLPIGGVVETEGVIVPSWVGYDIGCGMCAMPIKTESARLVWNAEKIFANIYRWVPTGYDVFQHPPEINSLDPLDLSVLGNEQFEKRKGFRSIGTLGGGNHFIEIGLDTGGIPWIVIHSGSRGVGHGIASAYMEIAGGIPGKRPEGHYPLRLDSYNGQGYVRDMLWATEFALLNRRMIMDQTIKAIAEVVGNDIEADWSLLINRNHNHAEETADGTWIHRKGATHAEKGMLGVIPGNMRDGSFIVSGLGNPESLQSSSHGAGRVMGRKQAKRELNLEEFEFQMSGIVAKVVDSTLDESPDAYKDIFSVMELQRDLVEIVTHIEPIINIKA